MGSPRLLVALALLASLVVRARTASADDTSPVAASPLPVATSPAADTETRAPECTRGSDERSLLGFLFDVGHGPPSFGARYMKQHRDRHRCGDMGELGSIGLGAEVRGEGTSAIAVQGVIRVAGGDDTPGFAGGLSGELAAGFATDLGRTLGTGSAALFLDLGPVDVGASYQIPIGADRPAWLGSLGLALRVHIPLLTYDVHEERYAADAHR